MTPSDLSEARSNARSVTKGDERRLARFADLDSTYGAFAPVVSLGPMSRVPHDASQGARTR